MCCPRSIECADGLEQIRRLNFVHPCVLEMQSVSRVFGRSFISCIITNARPIHVALRSVWRMWFASSAIYATNFSIVYI